MSDLLKQLGSEFSNIETVQNEIFTAKKIQLHSGMEGFDSPKMFGVYKNTGGQPLGVVGKTYNPMDLQVMLDSIVHSALECGNGIDLSTLAFREYKGGSKVAFTIDLPTKEIEGSPMVGDIVERRIEFRTGFDGKTKSSVTETFERLWCENGCTSTQAQDVAFKNTLGNHAKIFNLCQYISQAQENADNFVTNIGQLAEMEVNKKEIDEFLTKVTGYNVKEYDELNTNRRNILDKINKAVAIEMQNTGNNLFSLVNGITRYTTHDVAKQDEEKLFYSSANTMNNKALVTAFAMN